MTKLKRRIINIAEYFLSVLFFWGGIQVFFADPAILPGIFAALVGVLAIHVYGIIFVLVGLALFIAKWRKIKKLHKHSLFVMFLSCVYVLVLAIAVSGVSWGLTTTVLTGFICGYLWLKWTFDTEYLDPRDIRNKTRELR